MRPCKQAPGAANVALSAHGLNERVYDRGFRVCNAKPRSPLRAPLRGDAPALSVPVSTGRTPAGRQQLLTQTMLGSAR